VKVERVDFVGFLTQDVQRAKRFYTEILGLEVESEGEHDIEFTLGQVTLDVFDPSSIGQTFAPSTAGFALRVADVEAARAELEAKGVAFDGDTIETSVCKQAWFKDPDGNVLMLHRRFDA
jgi:catechol 2,3-dioxygenase-like lactoylglutathione lyase family enzyme